MNAYNISSSGECWKTWSNQSVYVYIIQYSNIFEYFKQRQTTKFSFRSSAFLTHLLYSTSQSINSSDKLGQGEGGGGGAYTFPLSTKYKYPESCAVVSSGIKKKLAVS